MCVFCLFCSLHRCCSHLKACSVLLHAGTKANLKRQGMMLSGSASKKQPSTLVSLDSESEVAAEAGEEMMFG